MSNLTSLEETGGNYKPEIIYNTSFVLEMRQGRKSKMYTLRRVPSPTHPQPQHAREQHITNLSTNKNEAWEKAVIQANRFGMELLDESFDELRKITRVADGYVNFGKHDGVHVSELPDGYLTWLADGAKVKNDEGYDISLACEELKAFAIDEAVKRELFVDFEGKLMNTKLRDFILSERKGNGHHYKDGDKITVVLNVDKSTSFNNGFGYNQMTHVYNFSTEDGKKFTYKGSISRYSVGDTIHVQAVVKYGEYRGQNVTYLQRLKDVPTQAFLDFEKLKDGSVLQHTNKNTGEVKVYVVSNPDQLAVTGTIDGKDRDIFKDELNTYGVWKIIKF